MEYIKVQAVEHDGDWFIIPNDMYASYEKLTEKFNSDDYPERYADQDEFEATFGHMRTGGDLNNTQLYTLKE